MGGEPPVRVWIQQGPNITGMPNGRRAKDEQIAIHNIKEGTMPFAFHMSICKREELQSSHTHSRGR